MGAECSCKITPSKGICTWLAMGFPGTTTLPDNKSRFLANFAKGSNEKISVPRLGGPAPPPTASAFAFRLGFCDSPSWERGRPARILSLPTRPPPPVPGRPYPAPLNGVLRRGAPDCPEMPLVANLAIEEKHKGTLLNYWNNLDRQILNSGYPTTSPTCPTCRASYSSNSTTSPTCPNWCRSRPEWWSTAKSGPGWRSSGFR